MHDDDRADLTTRKGVPKGVVFSLEDSAGSAYDLAGGKTATCHLWTGSPENPPGGSPALSVSSTGGQLALDTPESGDITLTLSAAETGGLAVGDYWYELVVYTSGGVVLERPVWGWVRHEPTGVGS